MNNTRETLLTNYGIISKLHPIIEEGYKWPSDEGGRWCIVFIVNFFNELEVDMLDVSSGKFYSEDNDALPLPKKEVGGYLTIRDLDNLGIPYMN